MKRESTPEDLIHDHLATCLAAMQDCLKNARAPNSEDDYGHLRRNDIAHFAKLMKASARLTEALAKLKGKSRHDIYVVRDQAGQITGQRLAEIPQGVDSVVADKGEG